LQVASPNANNDEMDLTDVLKELRDISMRTQAPSLPTLQSLLPSKHNKDVN